MHDLCVSIINQAINSSYIEYNLVIHDNTSYYHFHEKQKKRNHVIMGWIDHAMMATKIGQTLHMIIIKHPIIHFGSYNTHLLIH